MKTILSLIIAIILTIGISGVRISQGQTIAIGHVTAEVIESISASSQAVTSLSLGTNSAGTPSAVNLGAITVNSGSNVSVNVVIKSASLTDSMGNGFTLDPTTNSIYASTAPFSGSQTLQLNGTANLASDQASGLYQGSYTVVFAYN